MTLGQDTTLKCSTLSLLKMPKGEIAGTVGEDDKDHSPTKTQNVEETVMEVPGLELQVCSPLVTGPALRSQEYLLILRESAGTVRNDVLYLWKWNCIVHSIKMLVAK